MTHRFHENSPNKSVLNLLLAVLVVLCLWNVWHYPSETEEMAALTSSTGHVSERVSTISYSPEYISLSDGSSQHSLPVQTINGHKVVLVSSLRQLAPSGASPSIVLLADHRDSNQQVPTAQVSQTSPQPVHTTRRTGNIPSSRKLASATTSVTKSRTRSNRSTVFVVAISCSILAGGMMAKRALDKVHKWEQLSQEDSLAYDIAYTTTTSELGYGSFVSVWSGDLDKFDV